MNDLYKKMNSLFSKKNQSFGSYEREGVRPMRHWKFIVTLTVLVLFVCAAFSFYFYFGLQHEWFFTSETVSTPSTISLNTELLTQTVRDIESHRTKSQSSSSQNSPQDPSL